MNKKLITASAITIFLSAPALMFAFNSGGIPNAAPGLTVNSLIDVVFSILWPVAVAFFVIMFVLAGFTFFTARGDDTAVAKARMEVIWGTVGVLVALLAFSIPFIVRNTIGNGI